MINRLTYRLFKCKYIVGNIVGKIAILAVIPNLFNRIKFRGISRKPFNIDTHGKSLTQSSLCPAMNQPAVENKDNASRKVFQKQRYKCLKIIHPDVAVLNGKVQAQSPAFGRNADSRNCRKPVSSVPAIVNGRLAFWRPSAANSRLKHKTAFIDQYGSSAGSTGFFLYEANPSFASWLWPARCVLLLASRVFGNSSPYEKEHTRPRKVDTIGQNAFLLAVRFFAASTSRSCNRLLWGLSKEAFAILRAAFWTVCMALTEAVCWPVLFVRLFCTHPSIERQNLGMPRPFEQFRELRGRPATALPHGFCVARAVFVSLLVSCILLSVIKGSFLYLLKGQYIGAHSSHNLLTNWPISKNFKVLMQ